MAKGKKQGKAETMETMPMDDVAELYGKRSFSEKEKFTIVKRCLSDPAYFYNNGVSPYYKMAFAFVSDLIDQVPEFPNLHAMAGDVCLDLACDYKQAAPYYVKAQIMEPKNADYCVKAMASMCLIGNFDNAGKLLRHYEESGFNIISKDDLKDIKKDIAKKGEVDEIFYTTLCDTEGDWANEEGEGDKAALKLKKTGFKKYQIYYNAVLLIMGLTGIISTTFLLDYPFNEPYVWVFKNAAIPLGVIMLWLMIKFPMFKPEAPLAAKIFLFPIIIVLYVLLAMPLFGLINTYVGKPVPAAEKYTVVNKYSETDSDGDMEYFLELACDGCKKIKWKVYASEYLQAQQGGEFNAELYRGSLGLLFRYK